MSTDSTEKNGTVDAGGTPVSFGYQHANPDSGNESVLLRFGYRGRDGDACLLVDAGEGVDTSELLRPEDQLVGVCLTHAHFDHYNALSAAIDDEIPLFASPDTAAMLNGVMEVAAAEQGIQRSGIVADALVEVDDWTDVCPGVELHPLPAGHAPGAVGFLVRFSDGEETHDIVITGDFTLTDCAGYPGFDPELAADVECLFLTAATADDSTGTLTEALADTVAAPLSDGRCLVTCGALTGVHIGRLLAAVNHELGTDIPIRLVGQAAKLYDTLEMEHDEIETVTVFEDPYSCLTPGTVTIAGPDVPNADSSGRLFTALEQDATATVVQLISGGGQPVTRGGCTTHGYALSMHPTEDTLRDLVEALEPTQTVITHYHGQTPRFNDLPSCVRAPGDGAEYSLYEEGNWVRPEWMSSVREADTAGANRLGNVANVFNELPLPDMGRVPMPTLADEGIDREVIEERIETVRREEMTTDAPDENQVDNDTSDSDTTSMSESDTPSGYDRDRLFDTIGTPKIRSEPPAGFSEELPEPTSLVARRARASLFTDRGTTSDENSTAETKRLTDEDEGRDRQSDDDPTTDDETAADSPDTEASDVDGNADDPETPQAAGHDSDDSGSEQTKPEETLTVDPLLATVVRSYLAETSSTTSADEFVTDAIESFLGTLLRAEEPVETPESIITVSVSDAFASCLDNSTATAGFNDMDEATRHALAETLGTGEVLTVPLGRLSSLVATVVAADAYPLDTEQAVVEAAVARRMKELE